MSGIWRLIAAALHSFCQGRAERWLHRARWFAKQAGSGALS